MATPRTPKVTWYLCDLVTGRWLTRLPIDADTYSTNIAEINRASVNLNVADKACPDEWEGYLSPGYNRMLALCLDDQPAQGWWVNGDIETGDWTVPIGITSLEACYDNANVPELYGTYDDAYAASLLCTQDVGPDGTPTGLGGMGVRYGFTHEYTFTGNTTDHDYSAAETQTIYAALKAMMDDGRIEFRVILRWKPDRSGFQKVMQIRYRVGTLRKDSAFTYIVGPDGQARGTVKSYKKVTTGGVTAVTGSASVGGSEPIINPPVIATDLIAAGFPVVEERKSYTGLDSTNDPEGAIAQRTQATLAAERAGVVTYSMVLQPGMLLPGVDFDSGDTVAYRIDPRPKVAAAGARGTARIQGYTYSLKDFTVTPAIWPPTT